MGGTISTSAEGKPRPQRRWLVYILQALWGGAALLTIYLLLFSIRPAYAWLTTVCNGAECLSAQLDSVELERLTSLGISLHDYAVFQILQIITIAIISATVATIILYARPHEPFALFVSLVLLLFGVYFNEYAEILRNVNPALSDLVMMLPGITLLAFAILCYLFPDGHFIPGWTRWAAWAWIATPVVLIIAELGGFYDAAYGLIALAVLTLFATCLIAPIYRYRKLASRTQRQQLKWALFGIIQLVTVILVLVELLPFLIPDLNEIGTLPNIISSLIQTASLMIFPITLGIALLRYRLWDVDMILNRTLVYVPLTSILTVIYSTSMAVSQRLFITATGEQPQAVAIFTTIVLTTTFSPIKNSLQSYVDKHFKEAPSRLKELKVLDKQVTQVIESLDPHLLAQRVVETIVSAHRAQGAALYLKEDLDATDSREMILAYATPDWIWEEGEVSILLYDENNAGDRLLLGRLLLGRSRDRDDYTLEECDTIRTAMLPVIRNIHRLRNLSETHTMSEPITRQNKKGMRKQQDMTARARDKARV
jgi:hypothetical protein